MSALADLFGFGSSFRSGPYGWGEQTSPFSAGSAQDNFFNKLSLADQAAINTYVYRAKAADPNSNGITGKNGVMFALSNVPQYLNSLPNYGPAKDAQGNVIASSDYAKWSSNEYRATHNSGEWLNDLLMLVGPAVLPGLGNIITSQLVSAGVMTAGVAADAVGLGIANASVNIAKGQDPETAIKNAIVNTGLSIASPAVTKAVNSVVSNPTITNMVVNAGNAVINTAASGGTDQQVLDSLTSSLKSTAINFAVKDVLKDVDATTAKLVGSLVVGGPKAIINTVLADATQAAKKWSTDLLTKSYQNFVSSFNKDPTAEQLSGYQEASDKYKVLYGKEPTAEDLSKTIKPDTTDYVAAVEQKYKTDQEDKKQAALEEIRASEKAIEDKTAADKIIADKIAADAQAEIDKNTSATSLTQAQIDAAKKEGLNISEGERVAVENPMPSRDRNQVVEASISNATDFNEAYAAARAGYGAGKTFTWNGNSYSTSTRAEDPKLAAASDDIRMKRIETAITPGGGRGNVNDTGVRTGSTLDALTSYFGESTAKEDIAWRDAISKKILDGGYKGTDEQGLQIVRATNLTDHLIATGGVALGQQAQSFAGAWSTAFETSYSNGFAEWGKYAEKWGQDRTGAEIQSEMDAVDKRIGEISKMNWTDQASAYAKLVKENPWAVGNYVLIETVQEGVPVAAALTGAGLAIVAGAGTGTALTVAALASATSDALEVFGGSGKSAYDEAFKQAMKSGASKEQADNYAHKKAVNVATVDAAITLGTEFFADRVMLSSGLIALKSVVAATGSSLVVGSAQEFVEGFFQTLNQAQQIKGDLTKADVNNAFSQGLWGAIIAPGASTMVMGTGVVINGGVAVGKDLLGNSITFNDLKEGKKDIDYSSLNGNAVIATSDNGSKISLAGWTAAASSNAGLDISNYSSFMPSSLTDGSTAAVTLANGKEITVDNIEDVTGNNANITGTDFISDVSTMTPDQIVNTYTNEVLRGATQLDTATRNNVLSQSPAAVAKSNAKIATDAGFPSFDVYSQYGGNAGAYKAAQRDAANLLTAQSAGFPDFASYTQFNGDLTAYDKANNDAANIRRAADAGFPDYATFLQYEGKIADYSTAKAAETNRLTATNAGFPDYATYTQYGGNKAVYDTALSDVANKNLATTAGFPDFNTYTQYGGNKNAYDTALTDTANTQKATAAGFPDYASYINFNGDKAAYDASKVVATTTGGTTGGAATDGTSTVGATTTGAATGATTGATTDAATGTTTGATTGAATNAATSNTVTTDSMTTALAGVTADVKTKFDALTQGQQDIVSAQVQQGVDLNKAIDDAAQTAAEQIANVKTDLTKDITNVQTQFNTRVDELVLQGKTYQEATQEALKELGTGVTGLQTGFDEYKKQQDEAAKKASEQAKRTANTSKTAGNLAGALSMIAPALGSGLVDNSTPGFKDIGYKNIGDAKFESILSPFQQMVEKNVYAPKLQQQTEPQTQQPQQAAPVNQELNPQKDQEESSDYFSYGSSNEIDQMLGSNPGTQMLYSKAGGLATPLMAGGGTTRHGRYAGGGLNVVEHSGKARLDFRTGNAVTGPGDGQSDDIPAMLADGEFVFPADVVAALGNGSTKAGSDKLYDMMHSIRAYHRSAKPKDLPPPAKKSPLDYLKKTARKARR